MVSIDDVNDLLGDRYAIESELGRGATGIVFLGRKRELGVPVTIKVLHAQTASDRDRFEKEIRALSDFLHPNILPIIDSGQREGILFYVTQYVEGISLAEIIRYEGPLPIDDALLVCEAIASALEAAHGRGFIHRDIKPSNIIVPGGLGTLDFEKVLLVDFSVLGQLEDKSGRTKAGQIAGTPAYMAPEQIRGQPQSAATDIYGLGMLLYLMLYGHPPFQSGTLPLLYLSITQEPITFPENPSVPTNVKEFLQLCLHKDPDMRPIAPLAIIKNLYQPEAQVEPVLPSYAKKRSNPIVITIGAILAVAVLTFIMITFGGPIASQVKKIPLIDIRILTGVFTGIALGLFGILLGLGIKAWFNRIKIGSQGQAEKIIAGSEDRGFLTASLAREVDELLAGCQSLDERFLGRTLIVAIDEYQSAQNFSDRQTALVNMVDIMEKLMARLSPWYIKYDKLIAIIVSLVGIISGVVTVVDTIAK